MKETLTGPKLRSEYEAAIAALKADLKRSESDEARQLMARQIREVRREQQHEALPDDLAAFYPDILAWWQEWCRLHDRPIPARLFYNDGCMGITTDGPLTEQLKIGDDWYDAYDFVTMARPEEGAFEE